MKFHKLRFRYINSYHDEQVIDFDQEFVDSPIFLVNGATGAGKSTILDAISLALFGSTPRLTKSGKSTLDEGVMNLITDGRRDISPYAELTFSLLGSNAIRRYYKAKWEMPLNRNKTIDKIVRTIEAISPGATVLESHQGVTPIVSSHKSREVSPAFDYVLAGLTSSDFQRLIVLPQGQFDSFLNADATSRAKLLAQLTNTDYYKQIGALAYQKRADASSRLQQQESRIDGAKSVLMTRIELINYKKEFRASYRTYQRLDDTIEKEITQFKLLQEHKNAKIALIDAEKKYSNALIELKNFQPQVAELERYHLVSPLFSYIDSLPRTKAQLLGYRTEFAEAKSEQQQLLPRVAELLSKKIEAKAYYDSWDAFRDQVVADIESIKELTQRVQISEKKVEQTQVTVNHSATKIKELDDTIHRKKIDALHENSAKQEAWKIIKEGISVIDISNQIHTIKHISKKCQQIWKSCQNEGSQLHPNPTFDELQSMIQTAKKEQNESIEKLNLLVNRAKEYVTSHLGMSLEDTTSYQNLELWFREVSHHIESGCHLYDNDGKKILQLIDQLKDWEKRYDTCLKEEAELERYREELNLLYNQIKELRELYDIKNSELQKHLRDQEFLERRLELHAGEDCPLCGKVVDETIVDKELHQERLLHHLNILEGSKAKVEAIKQDLQKYEEERSQKIAYFERSKGRIHSIIQRVTEELQKLNEDSHSLINIFEPSPKIAPNSDLKEFVKRLISRLHESYTKNQRDAEIYLGHKEYWNLSYKSFKDILEHLQGLKSSEKVASLLEQFSASREELQQLLLQFLDLPTIPLKALEDIIYQRGNHYIIQLELAVSSSQKVEKIEQDIKQLEIELLKCKENLEKDKE